MNPSTIELVGAALFAVAIMHTFATRSFERLAHAQPDHAGLWHLLGEVEVVFGLWAFVLVAAMFATDGATRAIAYLDSCDFTEPMFVFAIMVVAGTRPILRTATSAVRVLTRAIALPGRMGFYLTVLTVTPLLGSFITEPAAMTLAALILAERIFAAGVSRRLKYATLGVLFVNVSIGGTLTPFAAPPVLMVAGTWHWDTAFMMAAFGWKATLAVAVNALGTTLLFMGVARAYQRYQDRLILREGLPVAVFLAGLVVLGGQQRWWLQPLLMRMSSDQVFFGAAILTAFTDNAALTYLGSLVDGLSDAFKYALVAGAVTGGGLTIIANAPNPAGVAILRGHFDDETVHPLWLLAAAMPPTIVAALALYTL